MSLNFPLLFCQGFPCEIKGGELYARNEGPHDHGQVLAGGAWVFVFARGGGDAEDDAENGVEVDGWGIGDGDVVGRGRGGEQTVKGNEEQGGDEERFHVWESLAIGLRVCGKKIWGMEDSKVVTDSITMCLGVCIGLAVADVGDGGIAFAEVAGVEFAGIAAGLAGMFPAELTHEHLIGCAVFGGDGGGGTAEGVGGKVFEAGILCPFADDGPEAVAGEGFAGGASTQPDEDVVDIFEGVVVADDKPVVHVEGGVSTEAAGFPAVPFYFYFQIALFEVQVVEVEAADFGGAQATIEHDRKHGGVAPSGVGGGVEELVHPIYFGFGEGALGGRFDALDLVGEGGVQGAVFPFDEGFDGAVRQVARGVGPAVGFEPLAQDGGGEGGGVGVGFEQFAQVVPVGGLGGFGIIPTVEKVFNLCLHDDLLCGVIVDMCGRSGVCEFTGSAHAEGGICCCLFGYCSFLGGGCQKFSIRCGCVILFVACILSSGRLGVTGPVLSVGLGGVSGWVLSPILLEVRDES